MGSEGAIGLLVTGLALVESVLLLSCDEGGGGMQGGRLLVGGEGAVVRLVAWTGVVTGLGVALGRFV